MHLARTRTLFFLAFVASASTLGGALYLEYIVGLVPCPLCVVQRALIAACMLICLCASWHGPGGRGWLRYSAALLICAVFGVYAASRQVWLQSSPPDDLVACLLNVQYMFDNLSLARMLWETLLGHADCAEINWSLFGITLPEWSMLVFVGLMLFALVHFVLGWRRHASAKTAGRDETTV